MLSPKIRMKTRISSLTISISLYIGHSSQGNQARKKNEIKLVQKGSKTEFADIILYIEHPKE